MTDTLTRESFGRVRDIIKKRDKCVCQYCGEYAPDGEPDHVLPLARGGSDDLNNMVWACKECNGSKGKRTVREWAIALHQKEREEIKERLEKILSNPPAILKNCSDYEDAHLDACQTWAKCNPFVVDVEEENVNRSAYLWMELLEMYLKKQEIPTVFIDDFMWIYEGFSLLLTLLGTERYMEILKPEQHKDLNEFLSMTSRLEQLYLEWDDQERGFYHAIIRLSLFWCAIRPYVAGILAGLSVKEICNLTTYETGEILERFSNGSSVLRPMKGTNSNGLNDTRLNKNGKPFDGTQGLLGI